MPSYTPQYGEIDFEFKDCYCVDNEPIKLSKIAEALDFDKKIWFIHTFIMDNSSWKTIIAFDNHLNIYKISHSIVGVTIKYYRDPIDCMATHIVGSKNVLLRKFPRKLTPFRMSDEMIEVCKYINDEATLKIYMPIILSKLIS